MSKVSHLLCLKGIVLIIGLLYFSDLQAQQSVGIGTTDPNPNAILDIKSDHQGILVPRLRTNQRLTMAEILQTSQGNDGMIVFDIEEGKFYYWFGGNWKEGLGMLTSSMVAGDLSGTLPAPVVTGLQGREIAATAPLNNQVLKWNGTAWVPSKDIGVEYSAGDGIQIVDEQVINSGDLDATDDLLKTDLAGGELSGTYDNLSISDNAVSTEKIADGAITTSKVVDQNITTSKIADDAITLDKIEAGAANSFLSIDEAGVLQWQSKAALVNSELEEGKILIGNAADLAEGRSISGDLVIAFDGQATIVNNSINSDKIIDGSINTIDIADGAIRTDKINTGAVTTDKIQDNTVANTDLNKIAIPLSGFGAAQEDVDLGNQKLVNVADPVSDTDASNKAYVDNKVSVVTDLSEGNIYVGNNLGKASPVDASASGNILIGDGTTVKPEAVSGDVSLAADGTVTIQNEAVTTDKILDNTIANADLNKTTIPLSGFGAAQDEVDLGNQKLVNVAAPVLNTDATNKAYVDNEINAVTDLAEGNVFVGDNSGKASAVDASGEGNILVGDGTTVKPVAVSGDIALASDGTATIEDNTVTTDKIADGAVTETKIASDAVGLDKLKTLEKNTFLITNADGDATWFKPGNNKVIITTNDGQIFTEGRGAFATSALPEGNIFIGNSVGQAYPFAAYAEGRILIGNGTTLASVNVDGDIVLDAYGKTEIQAGKVSTPELADDAVTTAKIQDDAVTTDKLLDGDVETADLADVSVTNAKIATNAVTNDKISDGTIQTADLSDASVTTDKILDATIINGDIADDAVTTDKIKNATIADEDLNKASIPLSGFGAATDDVDLGARKLVNVADPTALQDAATKAYVDNQISTSTDLSEGHIYVGDNTGKAAVVDASTSGNILVGDGTTVSSVAVGGDISLASDGTATISNDAVTTDKILDGSVQTADLADANVTNAKLSSNAVTSDKILDGTIANDDIGADAVTTGKILDGTIQTADLASASVTTAKLATDAVTTTKIEDSAVTSAKIADGTVADGDLDKANIPLSGFGAAGADVDLGSHKLTNVSDPTSDQDAATKAYVDALGIADGDKDVTNEIQDLSLTGNDLALSSDATPVDLSGYLDNTDDQQLTLTSNSLELEDGGSVDLSSYLDNTDSQDLGSSKTGNNVTVTIDDGAPTTFDIADGDSDAANESLTGATLDGTDLKLTESGTVTTVDLSYLDNTGTDDQQLSLSGNTLGLEDGGSVDLAPYLDNTDDQQLTLTGNSLALEDGGSVDLAPYLDNTDEQDLSDVLSEGNDANGGTITNLAAPTAGSDAATKAYVDALGVADEDKDATNEIQDLSLTGNDLALSGDVTPVDLSGYLDNTDSQDLGSSKTGNNVTVTIDDGASATFDIADGDSDAANESLTSATLDGTDLKLTESGTVTTVDLSYLDNTGTDDQQLTLTGNSLALEDGGSVDLAPYLDNTDEQDLSNVLAEGNDANGGTITNLAAPTAGSDAATKAYVDALGIADGDKDAANESLTDATLDGTDLKLTESGTVTTVDLSYLDNMGTDDQQLSLSGNALGLEDGGSVDLAPYLDNTDDQQLTLTGNSLALEDGGSVDLAPYLDNTDEQDLSDVLAEGNDANGGTITNLAAPTAGSDAATKAYVDALGTADGDKNSTNEIQDLSLTGNSLALSDDATSVDLSGYLDNTDDQQLTLTGNSLELEDGGSINLSSYLDNTDNQNLGSSKTGNNVTVTIDDGTSATFDIADGDSDAANESLTSATLDGTDLKLTESGTVTTVDLSYLDNTGTDDQQLTLTGNSLALEDGGSVDLAPYLDNTDEQDLSNVLSEGNDANGGTITNLAAPTAGSDAATKAYVDALGTADGDKSSTNEIQDLSLTGNSLALSSDATPVDLSGYLDNTDDQQLTLAGNSLELEDGGSIDLSSYLDNTDNQNLGSSKTGNNVTVTIDDGAPATFDIADGDSDAANESLTSATLDGTDLKLTESGNETTVDLSSLVSSGTRGSLWKQGAGAPTVSGTELNDDKYLNTSNGEIWNYNGSSWVNTGQSIQGPEGEQGPQGLPGVGIGTVSPGNGVAITGSFLTSSTISVIADEATIGFTGNDGDSNRKLKILEGGVTNNELAGNAVSTAKIQDGAITGAKIAGMSATSGQVLQWNGTSWVPATDQVDDADANATNEIQSLSISGNNIQLSGANTIPLSAITPTENQVLTWQSGAWRAATVSTGTGVTSKTGYYSVDPLDFIGIGKDMTQKVLYHNGASGAEFVFTEQEQVGPEIAAPLHLPQNARVSSIRLYFMNNSGDNINFNVLRKERANGTSQVIASFTSSGAPGMSNGLATIILNDPIDNSLYTYRVIVDLKPGSYNESMPHRIYSAVVEYTEEVGGISVPSGATVAKTYSGYGTPNDSIGDEGDFYIDTDHHELHLKYNGSWVKISSL